MSAARDRFHRFVLIVWIVVVATTMTVGPLSDRVWAAAPKRIGYHPGIWAITQARIVTGPGSVIEAGNLIIRDGLIVDVGPEAPVPLDAVVIDASGLTLYPGFIDAGTTALLSSDARPQTSESRKVDFSRHVLAASRPDNRHGLSPHFRAHDHLKLDSKILDEFRRHGFSAVHVLPSDRLAGGQGTLMSTADAPLRETTFVPSTFSTFRLRALGGSTYPSTLMGATAHLRQVFLDARRYTRHQELYRAGVKDVPRPPADPILDAISDSIAAHAPVLFRADSRDEIHRALDFCDAQQLPTIIWGGSEAHRCIDRLKQTKTSLLFQLDFGAPPKVDSKLDAKLTDAPKDPLRAQQDKLDRWKQRVGGLKQAHDAQLLFALSSLKLKNRVDFFVSLRRAIKEGLPRDAALAALTINAAKILNVDDRLGTLEPGKLAHVALFNGPFDHEDVKLRYLFADGHRFEFNESAKPIVDAKPAEAATTRFDGTWKLTIQSAEGPVAADLELTQSASRLQGTFSSNRGNGKVASGKATDATVEFVVSIGAGAVAVELKFSGTLKDDRLSGTLKSAFGAQTDWSATRVPVPEESNPVALTLDDKPDKPAPKTPTPQPTELQSDRVTRKVQTGGKLLLTNGTVLTATGKTLPQTDVLIREGKIASIGVDLKPDDDMAVVDLTGRFVMPGIIDTHSHIMITSGSNESTQSIVAEVSIRDVVNSDDIHEYRALAGGTTTVRILHGSSNVIGGQDAVVKLKYGKTASEHILHDAPQGVKFALGENVKYRTTRFPNTRMGVEATLNRAFLEAVDYRRAWQQYETRCKQLGGETNQLLPPRRDLRLEALADIVNHEKFIHSHCYRADEILMLLRVASNLGIRIWSLQHVLEGYKVAPEIVAHGASCSTFSDWWAYKVEAYDAIPHNAALLHEAGANTVIKSDDRELIRHLYVEAAKTIRYGNMHPDHALQTITRNPAKELGLSDRLGTIEVGKDGDLAIFSGHPLNAFSRCEQTIIDGEIYFTRADQPSAMSAAAAKASATPAPLVFPSGEIRGRTLDLSTSPSKRYALVGATLHPIDAPRIEGGTLLVDAGKIVALGKQVDVPADARVLDLKGLHVYPGLIDTGTTLGLTEIGKVKETSDYSESGQLQPDLRAGVAVNPDSELIPAARAGGVTTALVRPTGGTIAGQASLIQLAGWTAPEMVLDYEAGLQINFPGSKTQLKELTNFFDEARQYLKLVDAAKKENKPAPISDPRLEALKPYLDGTKPVFVEANSHKQIAGALLLAEEQKLKVVITGGVDAWKLAGELKKRDVPVLVGPVMQRPAAEYDPFDAPYANAGLLHEAGVRFAIRSNSASNSRNAPFEAAMAVAYGLPRDVGLRAVTLSAAELLGIDKQVGSLTAGKRANLIITDGSPLQQSTQIKGVFIAGRPFEPTSRQTRFYERYRQRVLEANGAKSAAEDAP